LKHLFEPDCRERQEVAVDETKIEIDGEEVYRRDRASASGLDPEGEARLPAQ
jgi:transposase-like protein